MIDSCKKQQQGFSEILPAGDVKPLKEKECLEVNSQRSLKEGQSLVDWGTENSEELCILISQVILGSYCVSRSIFAQQVRYCFPSES